MIKNVQISNGILDVTISELGAEMKSLKKDGHEVIWEGDPTVWSGQSPFLFPICGAVKDGKYKMSGKEYRISKHGFAQNMMFEITNQTEETVTFVLKNTPETEEVYPWEFECSITYSIENGDELEVTYDVFNIGEKKMYFSWGAHEAYACPEGIEEYSIIFEEEEKLDTVLLDGSLLSHDTYRIAENTKELALKNEYFKLDTLIFKDLKSRKVTLRRHDGKNIADVDFNGFDYLLIWTMPGAKFICIEPWCGIPDYNDSDGDITRKQGINEVESGKHFVRKHILKIY